MSAARIPARAPTANKIKTKSEAWKFIKEVVEINGFALTKLKWHLQYEVLLRVANALKYAGKLGCTKSQLRLIIVKIVDKVQDTVVELEESEKVARRKGLLMTIDDALVLAAKRGDQAAIDSWAEMPDGEDAEEDDAPCVEAEEEAEVPEVPVKATARPKATARTVARAAPVYVEVEDEEEAEVEVEVEEEERKAPVRVKLPVGSPVAGKTVAKGKVVIKQAQDGDQSLEERVAAMMAAQEEKFMAMLHQFAAASISGGPQPMSVRPEFPAAAVY